MRKILCMMFAALLFVSTVSAIGCGGEKEYKEPEKNEDVKIDGVPPMPGE